jgi:D-alanyl-lipoteichoic acid acyltransferase DltB (MBOAT superfamily)
LAGSFLFSLKYYEFVRETFQAILQHTGFVSLVPVLNWVAPVGVSFFTFQAVSYLVMVGRAPASARSWADVMLFLSFWPTLFAGPIWRAEHFFAQTDGQPPMRRVGSPRQGWLALYLIALGLVQKVVLASWLSAEVVDPVYKFPDQYASVSLAAAMLGYSLQIFLDFAGYTLVVTGLALLLGYRLPVNFRQPYLATSLSDFWRRWHITLSRWIRDYVYISLGGNRASWGRTQINLLIAMTLSGFWHGASITFVVWGLWHGLGLIAQNSWQKITSLKLPDGITQWLTFAFVCFGWLLFRAEDWQSVTTYVAGFSRWDTLPSLNWIGLLAAMVVFFMLARRAEPMMEKSAAALRVLPWWGQGLALVASALLIMELAPAGMPGFIYFGF